MREKNTVSMIDVAKHAGVSATTVSHVLNDTRYVSPEKRKRVLDSIAKLNYVPNASARTLKTGKTNVIQFVISDIANYFFVILIESIETALAKEGYQLLLANTHEDWELEKQHLGSITHSSVDGLILSTAQTNWQTLRAALPKDVPAILLDRQPENTENIDTVTISTYAAIIEALNDLYEEGHREIGMIGARESLSTTQERNHAYFDFIREKSLQPHFVQFIQSSDSMPECYQKMNEQDCTAVIVSNERMTEELVHYQYRSGETEKDGMTIVGFMSGNNQHVLLPRVIKQPTEEMGIYAAERILQLIRGQSEQPKHKILQAKYLKDNL